MIEARSAPHLLALRADLRSARGYFLEEETVSFQWIG